MLPDNWKEDPKFGIIAAVVVVLGGAAIYWLNSGGPQAQASYVCDACNNEFTAPVSQDRRPVCPKCGKAEGVSAAYVMCPNTQCTNRVFEIYRSRPNEAALNRQPGAATECKLPGQPNWTPDMIPGPNGSLIPNREADKIKIQAERTCPACKRKGPAADFIGASRYVPKAE